VIWTCDYRESGKRRTLEDGMRSSLDELKGQIAAGAYTIDSRELAGEIVDKFALVRRVTRVLMSEEASTRSPSRRRDPSAPSLRPTPRRERLS
jgi:hypothetical protein